jgi:hypothetical protein
MNNTPHPPGIHLIRQKGHLTKLIDTRVHKSWNETQTCSIEFLGDNKKPKPITISGSRDKLKKLLLNIIEKLDT